MSMPTDEEIEKEFKFHIGDKVILDGCKWTVINHHRRFYFDELPVQYLYTLQTAIGPHESLTLRDVDEDDLKPAGDSFLESSTHAENENCIINFKNGNYISVNKN